MGADGLYVCRRTGDPVVVLVDRHHEEDGLVAPPVPPLGAIPLHALVDQPQHVARSTCKPATHGHSQTVSCLTSSRR